MDKPLLGCFACGDIAGKPYQYIKAAGQGNVAALSAVEYLSRREETTVVWFSGFVKRDVIVQNRQKKVENL